MTKRRVGLGIAALALALLLALRLRLESPSPSPAVPADAKETSMPVAEAPTGPFVEDRVVVVPSKTPVKTLLGLRLLAKEEAKRRGWIENPPLVRDTEQERATLKLWKETKTTVNYVDVSLEEALADLRARYQLDSKIDPELLAKSPRVTFQATDLMATMTLGLILNIAQLASVVDPSGVLWITTQSRIPVMLGEKPFEVEPDIAEMLSIIRFRAENPPVPPGDADRKLAAWMKDKKVTVSIINSPATEAVAQLAAAAGLRIRNWTFDSKDAVATAPTVTLIGQDLPLAESFEALLKDAHLALNFVDDGVVEVETQTEHVEWRQQQEEQAVGLAEYEKLKTDLGKRTVRIEGACLTLSAVATQLAAQMGVPLFVDPALESCQVTWESDGLEQEAGLILQILCRDANVIWQYFNPFPKTRGETTVQTIWIVKRR